MGEFGDFHVGNTVGKTRPFLLSFTPEGLDCYWKVKLAYLSCQSSILYGLESSKTQACLL